MKPCKKCGSLDRNKKSGRCKPCQKIASEKWAKDHPDKVIVASRKSYAKNKNLGIAQIRAKIWVQDNPEKKRAAFDKWCIDNPEKRIAQRKKWAAENPDKRRALKRRCQNARKAQKKNAVPSWFNELDELIMREAADLCVHREKATGIKWEIDHKVPLQSKIVCGLHIGCNIAVITARANSAKGNRHWENMP